MYYEGSLLAVLQEKGMRSIYAELCKLTQEAWDVQHTKKPLSIVCLKHGWLRKSLVQRRELNVLIDMRGGDDCFL